MESQSVPVKPSKADLNAFFSSPVWKLMLTYFTTRGELCAKDLLCIPMIERQSTALQVQAQGLMYLDFVEGDTLENEFRAFVENLGVSRPTDRATRTRSRPRRGT